MVVLLQQTLQKGTEVRAAIGAAHEMHACGWRRRRRTCVVLDWLIAEERIHWDGATDILPFPLSDGHRPGLSRHRTRTGRDASDRAFWKTVRLTPLSSNSISKWPPRMGAVDFHHLPARACRTETAAPSG